MRFVPTYCLREGMTLAVNLYGKSGVVLLRSGTVAGIAMDSNIDKR